MDDQRFDAFIRTHFSGSSRRGLLVGLTSGLLALLAPAAIAEDAAAKKHRKGKRKKKRKKKERCKPVGRPCTPDGRTCCAALRCATSIDTFSSGQTVCCSSTDGASCTDNSGCCVPLLCSTATNTCFFRS